MAFEVSLSEITSLAEANVRREVEDGSGFRIVR